MRKSSDQARKIEERFVGRVETAKMTRRMSENEDCHLSPQLAGRLDENMGEQQHQKLCGIQRKLFQQIPTNRRNHFNVTWKSM